MPSRWVPHSFSLPASVVCIQQPYSALLARRVCTFPRQPQEKTGCWQAVACLTSGVWPFCPPWNVLLQVAYEHECYYVSRLFDHI